MACDHHLGSLSCDRADPHDPNAPGGHTYTATWAPDARHGDTDTQEDR